MPAVNTNEYRRRSDGVTEIVTRLGDVFLIDAEYEVIARRHCWSRHENGYPRAVHRVGGKLKTVYLHRLILPSTVDCPFVDHVNGDSSDARKENLRLCTHSQNMRNTKLRIDNSTGQKGVDIHAQTGKYRARVTVHGREFHLGLFDSADDAAIAVKVARNKLHGEYARHA